MTAHGEVVSLIAQMQSASQKKLQLKIMTQETIIGWDAGVRRISTEHRVVLTINRGGKENELLQSHSSTTAKALLQPDELRY